MAGQKLLLPYNFTSYDQKALEFIINMFAHVEEIEITLFHAYTPLPSVEVDSNSITGKLRANISYLNTKITEQEFALQSVKEKLIDQGISDSKIKCVFKPRKKDRAAEIISLHANKRFDYSVLSRKPGTVSRFFTGSVHNKVVAALKDVTVCIVS